MLSSWVMGLPGWKKAAAAGLVVIAVVGLVLYTAQGISSCRQRSKLEESQKKVDALTDQLDNLDGTIGNLKQQQAAKQAEVNTAIKERDEAIKETDEATRTASNALDRVNDIRTRDYNGTSPGNAASARCRAYPESCR